MKMMKSSLLIFKSKNTKWQTMVETKQNKNLLSLLTGNRSLFHDGAEFWELKPKETWSSPFCETESEK